GGTTSTSGGGDTSTTDGAGELLSRLGSGGGESTASAGDGGGSTLESPKIEVPVITGETGTGDGSVPGGAEESPIDALADKSAEVIDAVTGG
ncbi:MAG TPA: hypothetical protein VGR12_07565, partial [Solirubrobacteraceae bacterium]|nr:hypothetical protein [Solirubrobacteraceae bacterium]